MKYCLLLVAFLFIAGPVLAQRMPAPELAPIVYDGIEYSVVYSKGYIEMWDANSPQVFVGHLMETKLKAVELASQTVLWEKLICSRPFARDLDENEQEGVLIKDIRLEHFAGWDSVFAKDESDQEYEIVVKGTKPDSSAKKEKKYLMLY